MSDIPPIKIPKSSLAWAEVEGWCKAHLSKYRIQLESEQTSVDKVPAIRARIAMLKALLNSNAEDLPNDQS